MQRLLVCALFSAVALAQSSKSSTLIIHDVTVIDGTGAPAKPHQTIRVENGKIAAVDNSGTAFAGKLPGEHIDGSGKFLIPGLWDMHVHMVFGDWFPHGKQITLPLFIAHGITG